MTTLGYLLATSEPGKQGMNNERAEAASRSTTVDATWDETLELLEEQINTSSPNLRFLNAHGLLFATIVWLQDWDGAATRGEGGATDNGLHFLPPSFGTTKTSTPGTDKKVIPELGSSTHGTSPKWPKSFGIPSV